jgi:hypothetical protein
MTNRNHALARQDLEYGHAKIGMAISSFPN